MDILTVVSSDRRGVVAAPAFGVLALLWCGFSFLTIVSFIASLFLGYAFANWLTSESNGDFLSQFLDHYVVEKKKKDKCLIDNEKEKIRKKPWEDLNVSEPVSEAVEQLLEQIVDKYVNNWYETGISRDRAFLNDIKYQMRFACCTLLRRIDATDFSDLIVKTAVPAATLHLHRIVKIVDELDKQTIPPPVLETEICKRLPDLHFSLGSRANEVDYLRQLADFLLPRLLDDTRLSGRAHDVDSPSHMNRIKRTQRPWPSHPGRHFLRELLVNAVLLPLLDLIADPDTINQLLILLFDPEPGVPPEMLDYPRVPFLRGLTEQANEAVPDSLLQLKLSELLRDPKQFSMFRLYLQDTRGPVNELLFLAEANMIHELMQRKAINRPQISLDAWELYSRFVHESSVDKITFDEETVDEFREAMESKDIELLEKVIEKTYQLVYSRVQFEYVVPFCQSETFLGHLCGSPPVSIDDIISLPRDQNNRGSITEKTFSLAQFRSRLRKAIALSFEDDETTENYSLNENGITVRSSDSGIDSSVDETGRMEIRPESAEDAGLVVGTPIRPRACTGGDLELGSPGEHSELLVPAPHHSSSMPDFQSMPSIDVSFVEGEGEEDLVGSIPSPASASELRDDDTDSGVAGTPSSQLVVDEVTKDMNRWHITIPRIIPTRDPLNGRTMYVYVIQVDRHDAQPHETKTWTVLRRYNEMYVLEAKLNEFHGESLNIPSLPPRKTFTTKTRAFIEQHRICFASFISALCRQRVLCRSDLLFAFLASSEEFRDSLLLSDLNPWKVVKKMPGKLSRERGQNLRPFLLGMLATTLAPPEKRETVKEKVDTSESSSVSSFSAEGTQAPLSLYSPIFGNNLPTCKVGMEATEENAELWTSSFSDSLLLLSTHLVSTSTHWLLSLLSSVSLLSRNTIDRTVKWATDKLLRDALQDTYVVRLVRLIESSLFCSDGTFVTEQEKSLRRELAQRRTVEWIEDHVPSHLRKASGRKSFRKGILSLLQALQHPRLNKQLTYVLLDIVVKEIFPE